MKHNSPPSASPKQLLLPSVPYESCPIRLSLDCLGRKWALPILRDIALLDLRTFSQLLKNNSGLTPRELSIRLRDLQKEGVITKVEDLEDHRKRRYMLTEQGRDAVPILTSLIQYGVRHHAADVFKDKKPRELDALYPGKQEFMLGRLKKFALQHAPSSNDKKQASRYRKFKSV